ncbi:hypothetical protein POM88_042497 [Heracleum sosnowskyi]|uniref:DUF4378 domain-containing protein n=1 Tax=Heracleum sosnowskyi TaxID=360622 RepID=A0AAD8HGW4_9APIA|nr:hypothetical protein POM88_042497 [Heracleum sosnowskyi]
MAFTASVTKQLGELLQEQQEPFVLEIYLIDKGYRKNMLNSKKGTRNRFFKRPSRSEALFRRKIISSCSSAVKALLDILKVKRGSGSRKNAEDAFLRKEQHKLGNLLSEEEADRDIKMKKISEDRTQLSPISVLEATLSNEGSPVHANQTIQDIKTVREEISSETIYSDSYNLLENFLTGKTSEVNKHDSYSQYTKVKLALQQMKQLMFDYVKEIVETQRLKNRSQSQFREPMGAEALGKILCENILGWSTQSVHKNYSNQLLHTDILDSAEEWNDFKQGKGIGLEIADYILEDIISSDIVMDMIRL